MPGNCLAIRKKKAADKRLLSKLCREHMPQLQKLDRQIIEFAGIVILLFYIQKNVDDEQ